MHQTLSGHFSLRMSQETGPMSGGSFSCPPSSNFDLRAGPRPEGLLLLRVPGSKDFPLTILHHQISFVMSSDELITLMKPSLPLCQAGCETTHRSPELYEIGKKNKRGEFFSSIFLSHEVAWPQGQLLKSIRVTYSCHSKASTSDSHTARHRAQHWTGLGHTKATSNL